MQSPSQTWAKLELTGMRSDILVCERSAHPVLLHCLQDESHDWRHLQLVNASMCAAFRQYKAQVAEYMARRELRKKIEEMSALCDRMCSNLFPTSPPHVIIFGNNVAHNHSTSDFEDSVAWRLIPFSTAETRPATPVIEVD